METKIEKIYAEDGKDFYTRIHHKSGLEILVCEMPGFKTTEAFFGTKYGSINTQFKTNEDTDYVQVPEGIAHYLEHKLFENEDSDVFEQYAKTGASANAFTSFDKTCYYFSCTDKFKESLEILLNFVQSPYFTPETVAKEQGIIGQEIKMCNDDPSWRVFFNMLRGLFQAHPVKIDIAGTIESIAQITDKLLYRCYNTFYNLNNMVLAVAGETTVAEVLEVADRLLKPCKDLQLETVFPQESLEIVQAETVEKAAVGQPIFNIGIKCRPLSGYENLKAEMIAQIAFQILCGSSTKLYSDLQKEGYINSTFSSEVFNGDGFFVVIFEGESDKPFELRDKLKEAIANAKENGLDRELFEEQKKTVYGSFIRGLNNVSSVASGLLNTYMGGCGMYDPRKILAEMTLEDCERFIREEIHLDAMTTSVITAFEEE